MTCVVKNGVLSGDSGAFHTLEILESPPSVATKLDLSKVKIVPDSKGFITIVITADNCSNYIHLSVLNQLIIPDVVVDVIIQFTSGEIIRIDDVFLGFDYRLTLMARGLATVSDNYDESLVKICENAYKVTFYGYSPQHNFQKILPRGSYQDECLKDIETLKQEITQFANAVCHKTADTIAPIEKFAKICDDAKIPEKMMLEMFENMSKLAKPSIGSVHQVSDTSKVVLQALKKCAECEKHVSTDVFTTFVNWIELSRRLICVYNEELAVSS